MVLLHRLDGREVVINSDLIVTLEKIPDTVVALTTGDRIMVQEPVEEVIRLVAAFRRRARADELPVTPSGDENNPAGNRQI